MTVSAGLLLLLLLLTKLTTTTAAGLSPTRLTAALLSSVETAAAAALRAQRRDFRARVVRLVLGRDGGHSTLGGREAVVHVVCQRDDVLKLVFE